MPHSHRELFYHFTWSTKHRFPYIDRMLGPILIRALHRKAAGLGCHVFAANHMPDHIHLLLYIPPSLTVARAVRELKGLSYHDLRRHCPDFGWQNGYGVTTLRRSDLPVVQAYIANQAKHHGRAAVLDRDLENIHS